MNSYPTGPSERLILQTHEFGEAIEDFIFESKNIENWEWAHERYPLVAGFIENYPLSERVVEVLCKLYKNTHQRLGRSLNVLFRHDATKKNSFITIAQAKGLALPGYLQSLSETTVPSNTAVLEPPQSLIPPPPASEQAGVA
jgi:hypothetical protein